MNLFAPHGKKSELSGPEQRLILAYAAAPLEVQAAAVIMLEAAGGAPQGRAPRRRFSGGHAVATLDTTRPSPAWLDPTGTA